MKVSTSIVIDALAEQVWEVIGPGFTRVGHWVSAIAASDPTGAAGPSGAPAAGRACRVATAGFDQIAEELIAYEPGARRLSYRMAGGMPSFVTEASDTWQARALPDCRTEFTMDADVAFAGARRLTGPFLRAYLLRVGRRTSRDLKALVETGAPSRAKTIQIHASRRTALDWLVLCNAAFSALCGATLAVASSWWSRQFGDPAVGLIATVGVGLVWYAVLLAWGRQAVGSPAKTAGSSLRSTPPGWPAPWLSSRSSGQLSPAPAWPPPCSRGSRWPHWAGCSGALPDVSTPLMGVAGWVEI